MRCARCGSFPTNGIFCPGKRVCYPCERIRKAGVRLRNRERLLTEGPRASGPRLCPGCGEVKPISEFPRATARADGTASRCRPCSRAQHRAFVRHKRTTNPAWRAATAVGKALKRRRADPALVAKEVEARLRQARQALQKGWRREARALALIWALANAEGLPVEPLRSRPPSPATPERRAYDRAKTAWRRAKRLGRVAPWATLASTVPVYRQAIEREQDSGWEWHVDHRVPLRGNTASGLHCLENLVPLPRVVNEAKSDKWVEELVYS